MTKQIRRITWFVLSCCAALSVWAGSAAAMTAPSMSGLQLSGDFLYWRPGGLDTQIVRPTNSGGQSLGGATEGIQYGFAPGFDFHADFKNWRARWAQLQTSSRFSGQCPSGQNCLFPLQDVTNIGIDGAVNQATANSDLRLDLVDVDLRQPFGDYNESSPRTFYWALGARWARLRSNAETFYQEANGTTEDRQSRSLTNLFGLHSGLEGRFQACSKVSIEGNAGLSLLTGRAHLDDSFNGSVFGAPPHQSNVSQNVTVPVIEIGAKVVYAATKSLNAWVGYDFMEFGNAALKQDLVNDTDASTTFGSRSISFQGPRAGVAWRFE